MKIAYSRIFLLHFWTKTLSIISFTITVYFIPYEWYSSGQKLRYSSEFSHCNYQIQNQNNDQINLAYYRQSIYKYVLNTDAEFSRRITSIANIHNLNNQTNRHMFLC